jgi:hypothetical protein
MLVEQGLHLGGDLSVAGAAAESAFALDCTSGEKTWGGERDGKRISEFLLPHFQSPN